jgi:hypothetical protein
LSDEILDKQPYRDRLEDGTNVVAVADPRDRADLAERLRPLIEQPDLAREIGTRGLVVSCDFADFEETVDAWEDLLIPFAGDAPDAAERAADPPRTVTECLEEALPWLGPVVGPSLEEWVGRFQQGRAPADPGDPGLAEGFCAFLESCVDHLAPPSGLTPGCLRDIVRYQRARLWATRDDIPAASPGARSGRAPVTNALAGREPSPASIRRLSPVVGPPLRIERFGHDVTAVFCRTEAEPDDPADAWASVLPALQPRNTLVCFARLPNLAPCEQRINDATERVVALCDGRRTSEEVARDLTRGRGNGDGPQAERTEEEVLALLLKLYAAGLVVFQEPPANVSDARPKLLATIGEGVR